MFKKGLVTLVCLTVMSALWAWATTTYSISTKINSIGTYAVTDAETGKLKYLPIVGGDIKVRDGEAQSYGIKYSNYTTQAEIAVVVTPKAGYKISALTATGAAVKAPLPVVGADQTAPLTVTVAKPAPNTTGTAAYVVATFAPAGTAATVTKNWQLQVQNNTPGGAIKIQRATNADITHTTLGTLVKSYADTTPVTVTVTPAAGFDIDYLIVNGVKTFYKNNTVRVVPVDPSTGSRIKNVIAGYRKQSLKVTTNPESNSYLAPVIAYNTDGTLKTDATVKKYYPNGIEPVNPVADPTGVVRLIVTPTGVNNIVKSISVNNTNTADLTTTFAVKYFDRFGIALPNNSLAGHIGPVKVTISNITEPITVGAQFGIHAAATAAAENCTNTCHADPTFVENTPYVKAAGDAWAASPHAAAIECTGCHGTMPGPNMNVAATQEGICDNCHVSTAAAFQAGPHGAASGHTDKNCQRCHATEGALVGALVGWTGGYNAVLKPYTTAWKANRPVASADGITCTACHDHNGLRPINTLNATGTAVVGWDPNANGSNDDQYDVCTSCHTATDMYHESSSMDAARIISDSHADNAATGTVANVGTTVEGYVIRTTSANPCADCHNVHSADLHIQEEWANSAHGGHIAKAKADAVCAPALAWFNLTYEPDAGACTDVRTVKIGTSTRDSEGTVSELYGKTAEGIAALKAAGASDATGIAWTHYNWDQTSSRGACQRCHTATGSANFLKNPGGYDATGAGNNFSHLSNWTAAAGSPQQELLYCWGCHSDSQTGALNNPGALTLDYSSAANDTIVYANVSKSNVCVACHSGNGGSGDSIANSTGNFADLAAIQPHYLAAAGVLMTGSTNGGTGYEFAGVTYTKNGAHQKIGTANFSNTGTAGPCVACHMSGAEKHSFEVSAANAVCANCHNSLTPEVVTAAEARYTAALVALDNALKAKGIFFIPSYPYFVYDNGANGGIAGNGIIETGEADRLNNIKNWTTQVAGGNGKDTMGAAFNYNLLVHEPGAFAHNKAYAYELITSSLDYLADGAVDGAGIPAAVVTSSETDVMTHSATAETATTTATCDDCHTPTPHAGGQVFNKAQYVSTASKPVSCADCHGEPVSTTANEAILLQYAKSAHGDPDGDAWIALDWRTANRSACARCHNGSAFVAKLADVNSTSNVFQAGDVLKPGETLACSACHTDAETGTLRSEDMAFQHEFTINLSNGATVTYNVPGASALCVRCHSGRETGASINDTTTVFPAPHYLAAAGILYNTGGYEYSTEGYDTLGTNKDLGAGGQGPCVTCHMSGKSHTFAAVGNATDKASFQSELDGLKAALEDKGIYYSSTHPYFFEAEYKSERVNGLVPANEPVSDWSLGGTYAAKGVMGAAFNYALLVNEPGAYAHNADYARKLIADSIAFLAATP